MQNTFFFLENSKDTIVPLRLQFNNQNTLWFAMIGLAVSFILLATSKMASSNIVVIFSKVLYKNSTVAKIVKEDYNLNSLLSVILTINFFLTTSILLNLSYMTFVNAASFQIHYMLFCLPIIYFFWPNICLEVVSFISKEQATVQETKFNNIIFAQILGVAFSLLLLLWTFNLKWSTNFAAVFFILTFIFWAFRIFRGFLFSFQKGVAWYYLFLYFCTLEILPLILVISVFGLKIEDYIKFL